MEMSELQIPPDARVFVGDGRIPLTPLGDSARFSHLRSCTILRVIGARPSLEQSHALSPHPPMQHGTLHRTPDWFTLQISF